LKAEIYLIEIKPLKGTVLKKYLLSIISVLSVSFLNAEIPQALEKAFNKMEKDSVFKYAYYRKTINQQESMLESYNPAASEDERWKLISINDNQPDPRRIEEYNSNKNNSKQPGRNSRNFAFDRKHMKNFQIITESDSSIVYGFDLENQKNKKMAEYLTGEIILHKNSDWIRQISLYNQAPFSPAFSVKIDTFRMAIKYHKLVETGAVKIKTITTRIKAKAFLVKKINTEVKQEYFNYRLIK